jgi:hypothetical protein
MINTDQNIDPETPIDVSGSIFNVAASAYTLLIRQLKNMCEQFQAQIQRDDAAFNGLIAYALTPPYQSIEETDENGKLLRDTLDVCANPAGIYTPEAHQNFMDGLNRVISGALAKIYSDLSKPEVANDLQDFKNALINRTIEFAASPLRPTGIRVFNFVINAVAKLHAAISDAAKAGNLDLGNVRSKINYLTNALKAIPQP